MYVIKYYYKDNIKKTIEMIADYNNMPMMFWECNRLYFDRSLPSPKFGLMKRLNYLAMFEYRKNKKGKAPIKCQTILFSEYYDFDEDTFRNLMVHEMIHYYLAWNGVKTKKDHGEEFMAMAKELNEKYGLNITKTLDTSSFKRTEQAPKVKGIWQWLWK